MKLNKEQVQKFLPHREPFLFIDSVSDIQTVEGFEFDGTYKSLVGTKVIAEFEVKPELSLLAGHFPGNPILPGVIQVEMMAQAASMLFILTDQDVDSYKIDVALVGVDKARFRNPIEPPMKLTIKAHLMRVRGPIVSYDCQLLNKDKIMSEVSVLASIKLIKNEG